MCGVQKTMTHKKYNGKKKRGFQRWVEHDSSSFGTYSGLWVWRREFLKATMKAFQESKKELFCRFWIVEV